MRAQLLVLGLGNDILTDDAVGLLVARQLKQLFAGDDRLVIDESTEMGLALLDLVSGYESLLILDSVQTTQAEPGDMHEVDPDQMKALPGTTPHFAGIKETIELGRQLGMDMPKSVKILGIEAADPWTIGTHLTAKLESALPAVVEHIASIIRSELQPGPAGPALSAAAIQNAPSQNIRRVQ